MCVQFAPAELEMFHAVKRAFDEHGAAQSRQGGADAPSLRGIRAHARARRCREVSRPAALLMDDALGDSSTETIRGAAAGGPGCAFAAAAPRISTAQRCAVRCSTRAPIRGIVDYEPTELVLTARARHAARRDRARNAAQSGQMLAFEPPHFGSDATLRRVPRRRSVRPAPALRRQRARLRARRANARRHRRRICASADGDEERRGLRLSRLSGRRARDAGRDARSFAQGASAARVRGDRASGACRKPKRFARMNTWAGKPLPITATCHVQERLFVRLSGAEPAVDAARSKLGGETRTRCAAVLARSARTPAGSSSGLSGALWRAFASGRRPLRWNSPGLSSSNGTARCAGSPAMSIRRSCVPPRRAAGGHATLFRAAQKIAQVFHPLPAGDARPAPAAQSRFRSARDSESGSPLSRFVTSHAGNAIAPARPRSRTTLPNADANQPRRLHQGHARRP